MRPIQFNYGGLPAAVINSVALAQAFTGGGEMILNGTLSTVVPKFVAQIPPEVTQGRVILPAATRLTISSAGNNSSVIFTIIGTDFSGSEIKEVINGGNAVPVTTRYSFKTVTRITVDGVTNGSVTVGNAATGAVIVPLDIYVPNQVTNISVTLLSGAVTYSVEYTNEDPFDLTINHQWVPHPTAAMVGATASQTAGFTATLMRAVRLNITAGTGLVRTTIVQQSTQ